MAERNASDEAFAGAITEEAVSAEADAQGSAVEEPAADAWPEEAAAQVPDETADETADEAMEAAPNDVAAAAGDGAAPTVKEIIRRVGDLARELERAEAARRAARGGGETDGDRPDRKSTRLNSSH